MGVPRVVVQSNWAGTGSCGHLMKLVTTITRVTEVYRVGCPHCRSGKDADVTLTRDEQGKILEMRIECELAPHRGQDPT